MITTITLNPAIDRTILVDKIEYGYVNRMNRAMENIGGKGINVSKIVNQLGDDTVAIGFLGGKNRIKADKMLESDGVASDFIYLDDDTRTNSIIVEIDRGITTNINEAGFTVSEDEEGEMMKTLEAYMSKSEYMVFSGSIPKGMDKDIYKKMIQKVNGQVKTLLDADGETLIEGIKASPTIIKPNIHELENAFNVELKTDQEIVDLSRKLILEYRIKMVLISMGGEGSLLITNNEVYKADPVKVEVKNTVGAGDSMVGGFLHGLKNGMELSDCLRYGTACGTLAVMTPANQIIDKNDLEDMLERVKIHRL